MYLVQLWAVTDLCTANTHRVVLIELLAHWLRTYTTLRAYQFGYQCISVPENSCNHQIFGHSNVLLGKDDPCLGNYCGEILQITAMFLHSNVPRQLLSVLIALDTRTNGDDRGCFLVSDKWCARWFLHDCLVLYVNDTLEDDRIGEGWSFALLASVRSSGYVYSLKWTASIPAGALFRRYRCRHSILVVLHAVQ